MVLLRTLILESRLRRQAAAGAAAVALCLVAGSPGGAACLKTAPLFTISSAATVPLRQPADLTLHGDRLFVLDDLNARVISYGLEGKFLSATKLPGGSSASYLGFDVGGDDNLYLAASGAGKIVVINQKGERIREFPTGGGESPTEPVGVEVARGQCFVVDNEAHSVKVYDLEGTPSVQWGELGDGPGKFRYPFRLLQDPLGRIIVSDSLNSRIKIFTPAGDPLLEFGEFGVTEGTLYRPAGLGLWGENLLLVADNYLGVIQVYDLQGGYQSTLCGADNKPLIFSNPVSLAVRGSTVFVLEMGAGRVRALQIPGRN